MTQPTWNPALRDVDEIQTLLVAAAAALMEEDRNLRALLSKRGEQYKDVGYGLSCWPYETTLVYLIFRSWLSEPGVPYVAWDWTVAELKRKLQGNGTRPRTSCQRAMPEECGGLRYDLVLLENGTPTAAFEAKWWQKGRNVLDGDVVKLRDSRLLAKARKFLLAFWHEEKSQTKQSEADVRRECKRLELELRGIAHFDANFLGGTKSKPRRVRHTQGSFAMAVMEVKNGDGG